eukprot:674302-Pleurochrysis_carterae.AAC.1
MHMHVAEHAGSDSHAVQRSLTQPASHPLHTVAHAGFDLHAAQRSRTQPAMHAPASSSRREW